MYRRFAFDAVQGSKNLTNLKVLPPIGESFPRQASVHLEEIHVLEGSEPSEPFQLPINQVQIYNKKTKSVHFDQFVYVR